MFKNHASEINTRKEEIKKSEKVVNATLLIEGEISEVFHITAGTILGAAVGGGIGSLFGPGGGTAIGTAVGGAIGGFIVKKAMDWLKSSNEGIHILNFHGGVITGFLFRIFG
ncbi:hypothetical protein ACQ4LE_010539 [Meloidogyne hapla]|uniref:Gly-zipper_Omp domain-containing protein n=1 Tax=Meloidogyne hapla TaxID=6305 RepID=A0A1I8BWL5_MELHA